MFTGNFRGELSLANTFQDKQLRGILFDKDATYFSDAQINVILCGGLYNRLSLGYSSSYSDAQIICLIYKQKGTSAFSELDGSFTFILLDGDKTIIVRDHHGTNSQVYYNNTHFASSLLLLKKTPGCSTKVNESALGTFLSVGYIPTGSSSFDDIVKMSAGSMLIFHQGKLKEVNLFDTSFITPAESNEELSFFSEQYGNLHRSAIQRRIGDSRNVGILLSGGYDSGCNLAALRKIYGGDIRSFSIGFKGDNWSELPLAQCMSEEFGTIHSQYEIDGSEIMALPDIVNELGDPFVEGGLMVNYAAMRMVGSVKPDVILGGDGSDQYFGTSGREVAIHYLASKYGVKLLLDIVHKMLSNDVFDRNNMPYRLRFHLSKILGILQGDIFGFEPFAISKLLKNRDYVPCKIQDKPNLSSFEHLYVQHAYVSDLEKIINQVILFKASRMAEMFGNNIVFPYMDLELYKFLQKLPVKYKCKGEGAFKIAKGDVTAKFLLKYHYKPQLPELITSKKKQGGFAPMPIFFNDKTQRNRLAEFIMYSAVTDEFLDRNVVEQFIKTYDTESTKTGNWFWYKQNKAIQYFNLLTIAVWWEQYVKSKQVNL